MGRYYYFIIYLSCRADNPTTPGTPKAHFGAPQLAGLVSILLALREYVPVYIRECRRRKPHHLRWRLRQVQSMKRIFRSL